MARRKNDFYPTPARLTEILLEHLAIEGAVFEPCVGEGDIANVLRARGLVVWTNDIDPARPADSHEDAADYRLWSRLRSAQRRPAWVISNPPFSQAMPILARSWGAAEAGVAMLLRLTFLEPAGNRADWLDKTRRQLTHLVIFGQPRPSFTGNGKTDSVTAAWMVWQKRSALRQTNVVFEYGWRR